MPQDPDLVHRYSEAHQEYERASDAAGSATEPQLLDAKERYRDALAAYVLDLHANGMTVADELQHELDELTGPEGATTA
jgi:hypothetical protein